MAPSQNPPTATNPPSSPQFPQGLTPTQLSTYHKNGYLLIPSYLSPQTVRALLTETHSLLSLFDPSTHPLTRFTTGTSSSSSPRSSASSASASSTNDEEEHVSDTYFLTSGDKIRHFLEPAAEFDPGTGRLLTSPPHLAVNKIGHYVHELSPSFREATILDGASSSSSTSSSSSGKNYKNAEVARSLGFRDPRVLQSMIICKPPHLGAAVSPHRDNSFLYTDPPSAVGFWFALEDAGGGNGGLWFVRGSHRRGGGVGKRFVRKKGGSGTEFVHVEGRRVPEGEEEEDGREKEDGEVKYTLEEVKAGTLVLIHGNVLHKSERNLSGKSRFIYTFHIIEGEHEYDGRNWLQPPKKGFTRLYQD